MAGYQLIRSKRKTLALEITRELEILVRAPLHLSAERIDTFVASREDWIQKNLIHMQRRRAAYPEPSPEEAEVYRQQAKAYLPQRVAFYSKLMGLSPAGITITGAKTRFGSCSGKNRLAFSWRLMAYPPEAIDYVVVHELAHIAHKNHSAVFYALIARYLPDWQGHRALLRA